MFECKIVSLKLKIVLFEGVYWHPRPKRLGFKPKFTNYATTPFRKRSNAEPRRKQRGSVVSEEINIKQRRKQQGIQTWKLNILLI